jgi:capsular polysaccharide biosynthesis protein
MKAQPPNANDDDIGKTIDGGHGEPSDAQALATLTEHTQWLQQQSSVQEQFARRALRDGFSHSAHAETIVLSDQAWVDRPDPLHFSIQDGVADPEAERARRFAPGRGGYMAERLYASRLPGAMVDPGTFVICPTEQQYLLDSFRYPTGLTRWGYEHVQGSVYRRERKPIEERDERVVVLGAQTNYNYSHWLIESVARVLAFAPLDDGSPLYLTPRLEPWQREALSLAGVPTGRLLEMERRKRADRRKLVRFREIFAVSRGMSVMAALIPAAVTAVANLTQAIGKTNAPARRRLFVSRARAELRHITNEPQLVEVLATHGFHTVHPQDMSVSEQIAMFANAEVVIGSFGSGLTGLIFSPPGTLAIELQPEDISYGGNSFLWHLTSIRDQRFAQIVCPVTEGMRHLHIRERDMTVDLRQVDRLLDELLTA